MDLAFRRPRANRGPGHSIGKELGRDRVEELATGGQAKRDDIQQQPASEVQAVVDRKATVELWIVDQPAPSHGTARFLEVYAHDDAEIPRELISLFFKLPG